MHCMISQDHDSYLPYDLETSQNKEPKEYGDSLPLRIKTGCAKMYVKLHDDTPVEMIKNLCKEFNYISYLLSSHTRPDR